MADHETLRRAGEAAVRDHRHGLAQSLADDGRGDLQHLAHPGPATRAFVADDHGIAGLDLAPGNRRESVLFAVEHASRTAMRGRRVLRHLHHRAVGGQRAAEHDEATLIA